MSNPDHARVFIEPPMWLSVAEVAARLECSVSVVRNLITSGRLKAVRLKDRLVRVKNHDLEAYMDTLPAANKAYKVSRHPSQTRKDSPNV